MAQTLQNEKITFSPFEIRKKLSFKKLMVLRDTKTLRAGFNDLFLLCHQLAVILLDLDLHVLEEQ